MNKKVLSAILFSALFAGTGTFTSCIDNDEPAGIEELRGAKAELIRAKVAVEQAQAAYTLAQAEVEKAKAAIKNAKAEYEKAVAEGQKLANELAAAQNEQAKAEIEAAIAEAKQAAEVAAIEHEAAMLEAKTALATAERTYELTLAKIEVAKELLPYQDMVEISYLQGLVNDAQGAVDAAVTALESAKAEYDEAAVAYKYKGETAKKRLENAVAKKEGLLAVAKENLAKWESFLEKEVETADWRAEIDSLVADTIALTKKVDADLALKKARYENSDEYKALKDAVTEANKAAVVDTVYGYKYFGAENATTLYLDGTVTKLDATGKATDETAKKVEITDASLALIAAYNDDVLASGKLYNDKKELAGFTAEVKHFLDSVAAMKAESDTIFEYNSKVAIKNWKDALKAYENVDETDAAKLTTAQNAYAAYRSDDTKLGAFRTALVAYYKATAKNGTKFNNVPVQTKGKITVAGQDYPTSVTELKAWTDAIDNATTGNANVHFLDSIGFDFFDVAEEIGANDSIEYKDATSSDKKLGYYTAIFNEDPITAEALLTELQIASKMAFGDASMYNGLDDEYTHGETTYLHVQPDSADVMNIVFFKGFDNDTIHADKIEGTTLTDVSNGAVGAYGKFLVAKNDEVKAYALTYKDRIKNLEGAIAYWEASYKTLNAAKVAQAAAYDAAVLARDEYQAENIDAIADEILVINAKKATVKKMIAALTTAVNVYLADNGLDYNSTATKKAHDLFVKSIQDKIDAAQSAVETAEDNLAVAQIALETNGEADSVINNFELKKAAYENAQADLDEAQEELDTALEALAKAIEIFAATSAE